jgi:DNA-binding HxlR family transcriptional regulator
LQVVKLHYFCAMAKQGRRSDCPINFALELFGDKWTFLIIRDMMFKGKHSYGEFLVSEEKIATNILADRLSLLERAGIINKSVDPSHGSKFIYRLTAKGIDLMPILVEIIVWSAKYDPNTATDRKFLDKVSNDREALINSISTKLMGEFSM